MSIKKRLKSRRLGLEKVSELKKKCLKKLSEKMKNIDKIDERTLLTNCILFLKGCSRCKQTTATSVSDKRRLNANNNSNKRIHAFLMARSETHDPSSSLFCLENNKTTKIYVRSHIFIFT